MKKIVFEKIKIRNFLSFGPNPVEFEYKNGLHFLTGYNKDFDTYNGVGKTTLLVESISFALFGDTYRGVNQSGIINETTNETCIVELWFKVNDVSYKITRSLKPNKLILLKEDQDISRTVPETNKDIIAILGVSKTIFNNTLVMTNNQKNNFLGQKTDLKTKFIEGILSLEVFSKMLEKAKKEYLDQDKLVDKSAIIIKELKNSIDNDIRYKDQEDANKKRKIENQIDLITRLQNTNIIDYTDKIASLMSDITKDETFIEENSDKLSRGLEKKASTDSKISTLQHKIRDFNNIRTHCPTCKKPIDDHNPEEIEKEKKIIQEELDKETEYQTKLLSAIKTLQNKINTAKTNIRNNKDQISQFNIEQKKFDELTSKIKQATEQLEDIKSQENPFVDKIKTQEERLSNLSIEHEKLEKELQIRDVIKFVVSGQGVKSIIIKKIIDVLNGRLKYYLTLLKSPYTCEFNEFFEEKIISSTGKEVSYENASAGELKRIELALLFAFRDIRRLQSNAEVNLTIFDELLDSAICSKCMDDVINMLKDMSRDNGECYYIITHKSENIPDDCNMIRLTKENGITTLNT